MKVLFVVAKAKGKHIKCFCIERIRHQVNNKVCHSVMSFLRFGSLPFIIIVDRAHERMNVNIMKQADHIMYVDLFVYSFTLCTPLTITYFTSLVLIISTFSAFFVLSHLAVNSTFTFLYGCV